MSPTEQDLTPRELEAILDSLVEGLVLLDAARRVRGINRAACDMLGIDRQRALREDCHGLFGEKFCSQAATIRDSVERGCSAENVLARLDMPDGRPKVLHLSAKPLPRDDGHPPGSLVVFRDVTELVELREDLARRYRLHNIVGKSKPMQEVFRLIEEVADSDATVLIEGESGTGKELVARAIHYLSPRADGPFVAVNCSALAEGVLESELFGHVRGAFTGAVGEKQGRFEAAAGGTIFLDEIGDVSPAIQVKLLRVLQERSFEPVGSHEPRQVDIRVMAATNRPLSRLVEEGSFRRDLYYRLRVVPIEMPPLRRRREDIPLLVQHFVDRFREETGRPIEQAGQAALGLLIDAPWPGNVRELENAIEYAFVKARGGEILPEHLPPELRQSSVADRPEPDDAASIETGGDDADPREQLRRTLAATDWNIAKTARRLNLSRTTVYDRIKRFGLTRPGG
jgi:PAS domain S-box-containing protein